LEARNLLKRLPSVVDRRSYVLHLTSEGRKALVRMRAIVYESEKRLAQKFSPDAERLRQALAAFRDDQCKALLAEKTARPEQGQRPMAVLAPKTGRPWR